MSRTIQLAINKRLQALDPELVARFVPSDDIESEDDSFTVTKGGVELRHALTRPDYATATYAIQCCTFGGGFAADQYLYDANGDLQAVGHLYEGRSAIAAASAIIGRLLQDSPAHRSDRKGSTNARTVQAR